jgi:hypothetical protein
MCVQWRWVGADWLTCVHVGADWLTCVHVCTASNSETFCRQFSGNTSTKHIWILDVTLGRRWHSTQLHGVTSQTTIILTASSFSRTAWSKVTLQQRALPQTTSSLPCSQQSATCLCPQTNEFSPPLPSYCYEFHCNIIIPSMPRSSKLSLSDFPSETLHAILFPHTCYTSRPAHHN